MRPLEVLLIALTASASICILIGGWARISRLLLAGALLVLLAHGILEGVHWQMIPAYLATGIVCVVALKQREHKLQTAIITASATLLFIALSITLLILLPVFHLPSPTGIYPVGTSILCFKDSARNENSLPGSGVARELMVQIWYPAQPSHNRFARYREPKETSLLNSYLSVVPTHSRQDAQPATAVASFPVILLNHGWQGTRTSDTFLTEELASHGYVVVSIDHTYNAGMVAFPDGRVVRGIVSNDINAPETSNPDHVRAIWDKELATWVADQRFILDRLREMNRTVGTPWFGRLNTNMVGALGFSFGGAAATAVCAEDARVRAAVNMDGWFFGAIHERGPNQPLLFIESYTNEQQSIHASSTVEDVLNATDLADVETSLRSFGGEWLSMEGTTHDDFTDHPLISPLRSLSHRGALPAQRVQFILRAYVLAFFDKTLRGTDPGILHVNAKPYAEALLEEWPVK